MEIIDLQIGKLNEMLTTRALEVRLTVEAKLWLIKKTCSDRSYGARPLKRALQKNVEDELSEALIQGNLSNTSIVEVFPENDKLSFREIKLEQLEDVLFERA